MPKHLVFVGGGHAHRTALAGLRDTVRAGHRVTVIGPSPYHYYSGMGPGLLSGIYRPAEARFHVKMMAQDGGATFIEDRVVLVDPVRRALVLGSGAEVRYDAVSFNTGSEVPSDLLHPSGEDGGLLVNEYLQCIGPPELFGGGDCVSLAGSPLARVGVFAVRQNRPLHRNLSAFLEGRPLQRFDPGGDYLLILNLGDRMGLFRRKGIVRSGRLAFQLKNYLDTRFMGKFQVSGELREPLEE